VADVGRERMRDRVGTGGERCRVTIGLREEGVLEGGVEGWDLRFRRSAPSPYLAGATVGQAVGLLLNQNQVIIVCVCCRVSVGLFIYERGPPDSGQGPYIARRVGGHEDSHIPPKPLVHTVIPRSLPCKSTFPGIGAQESYDQWSAIHLRRSPFRRRPAQIVKS
jgi:hypothetical protein